MLLQATFSKLYKQHQLLLFLVIIAIICCGLLPQNIKAETRYKVVTENLPPFQVFQDGKVKGSITALVQKTLNCAHIEADFSILPWNRAFNNALKNKYTLIYSMARTPEREEQFIWIGPVHTAKVNLYKLKSRSDIKINSLNDVKNYRLSLLRGGFIVKLFTDANFIEGTHFRYTDNNVARLKMLFAGRHDLIDALDLQIVNLLSTTNHTRDELEVVMPLVTDEILYLAINKQTDKEIVKTLRKCLSEYNYKVNNKLNK